MWCCQYVDFQDLNDFVTNNHKLVFRYDFDLIQEADFIKCIQVQACWEADNLLPMKFCWNPCNGRREVENMLAQ